MRVRVPIRSILRLYHVRPTDEGLGGLGRLVVAESKADAQAYFECRSSAEQVPASASLGFDGNPKRYTTSEVIDMGIGILPGVPCRPRDA